MSRQLLIDEIERLYVEKGEQKDNLRDEVYVFQKYPELAHLFGLYRTKDEKWHQLAREVLFYEKQDLRYLYNRLMQLVRRFRQPLNPYFEVSSATGTYLLPDRLSDLNRLSALFREFFFEIYPSIARRLNFEVHNQTEPNYLLGGKVDWRGTILNSIRNGTGKTPLRFWTVLPLSGFETPENLLLVFSILRMNRDAVRILSYPFAEPLGSDERALLQRIIRGCARATNLSMLQELIPAASKYLSPAHSEANVRGLEANVAGSIRGEGKRLAPYSHLLDWSIRYREMNLRLLSPNRTNFPIDKRENLDTMFELWILYEYLDYLSSKGASVNFESSDSFAIEYDGLDFHFCYQKKYNDGWAVKAKPDFTIEMTGRPTIVMDAKNWQEDKGDAIYKMLGYMNNLDAELGILFFPNKTTLQEKRVFKGEGLKAHLRQCYMSGVVPPSGSEEATRAKVEAFDQVTSLVKEYLQ